MGVEYYGLLDTLEDGTKLLIPLGKNLLEDDEEQAREVADKILWLMDEEAEEIVTSIEENDDVRSLKAISGLLCLYRSIRSIPVFSFGKWRLVTYMLLMKIYEREPKIISEMELDKIGKYTIIL